MAMLTAVLLLSGALLTRKHSSDLPIRFMVVSTCNAVPFLICSARKLPLMLLPVQ